MKLLSVNTRQRPTAGCVLDTIAALVDEQPSSPSAPLLTPISTIGLRQPSSLYPRLTISNPKELAIVNLKHLKQEDSSEDKQISQNVSSNSSELQTNYAPASTPPSSASNTVQVNDITLIVQGSNGCEYRSYSVASSLITQCSKRELSQHLAHLTGMPTSEQRFASFILNNRRINYLEFKEQLSATKFLDGRIDLSHHEMECWHELCKTVDDLAHYSEKEKTDLAEDALASTDRLLSSKFFTVYEEYRVILDEMIGQYEHCLREEEQLKLRSLLENPYKPFNKKNDSTQSRASIKKDAIYASQTLFQLNSENFENLVEGGQVIADKTMFLAKFFNTGNKKILVTMPRGFGKTTLLTMTKTFFGIPVDSRGKPFEDVKQSPAYKLFANKHRTQIFSDNRLFFSEHFGQYPVVYITLRNVVGPSNKILSQFKNALQQTYMDFQYVYDELKLRMKNDEATSQEERDCAFMKQVLDDCNHMDSEVLVKGLSRLIQILKSFHNKRTIVLVDEYDTLAMASARREPSKSVIETVQHAVSSFTRISKRQQQNKDKARHEDFFNQFLDHTFKGNANISHAIIAGITRVVSDNLSDLRFENCSMYRNKFAQFFGFTEAEIEGFARFSKTSRLSFALDGELPSKTTIMVGEHSTWRS